MSINNRNIDTDELAKESQGTAMPSGTGTHDVHRVRAGRAATDRQRRGVEARKAGPFQRRRRPTICVCAMRTRR